MKNVARDNVGQVDECEIKQGLHLEHVDFILLKLVIWDFKVKAW